MGLTHVVVREFNSESEDTYKVEFLVNTGTMDTMAPASELKKIGMQPVGKDVYEMANGELVEYEYGNAKLTFMGEVTCTRIIFGPDDSQPFLGKIALLSAGARPLKRVA